MERPTAVTVLSVISLIFGALGVASLPMAGFWLYVMLNPESSPVPVPYLDAGPFVQAWMFISMGLGAAISVFLIFVGSGLLRMKPWARRAAIAYALVAIVLTLAGAAMNVFVMPSPAELTMVNQQTNNNLPGGATVIDETTLAAARVGGTVGVVAGTCFSLLLPVALLVVMTRPSIIEAFRAAQPEPLPEPL